MPSKARSGVRALGGLGGGRKPSPTYGEGGGNHPHPYPFTLTLRYPSFVGLINYLVVN